MIPTIPIYFLTVATKAQRGELLNRQRTPWRVTFPRPHVIFTPNKPFSYEVLYVPSEPRRQTNNEFHFVYVNQHIYYFLMPSALIYTKPTIQTTRKHSIFFIVTTNLGEMGSKLNPMGFHGSLALGLTPALHQNPYECWNIRDKEDDSCKVLCESASGTMACTSAIVLFTHGTLIVPI